jgi:hypothetical protein
MVSNPVPVVSFKIFIAVFTCNAYKEGGLFGAHFLWEIPHL